LLEKILHAVRSTLPHPVFKMNPEIPGAKLFASPD
jgi:hypothetical protein